MTTFFDTNVLISILDSTDPHHTWSTNQLVLRKLNGPILISDIVYSEFSVGMPDQIATDEAVATLGIERHQFSDAALFNAGRAYKRYRTENDGPKLNVLSDYLIGAQAEAMNFPLVTADVGVYGTYFPQLELVSPE